jgi:IS30 family transposase
MKKDYKHLSVEERDHLAVLKGKGHGVRDIARILKRSPIHHLPRTQAQRPNLSARAITLAHRAHQRYVVRNQQRALPFTPENKTNPRLRPPSIKTRLVSRTHFGSLELPASQANHWP